MILCKCKEDATSQNLALLRYVNMKIKGLMYSPLLLLFNRQLRDNLPLRVRLFRPEISVNVKQQLINRQSKQAAFYNRHSKACNEFEKGKSVRVTVHTGGDWTPSVSTYIHTFQIFTNGSPFSVTDF